MIDRSQVQNEERERKVGVAIKRQREASLW